MEDKAKCGGSLYWHNCYSGSHDLLTGNSMAHPAKMSPKLCFRILEHLEELGLASPEKDTILDPMAGTGLTAICAGAKGYKAVTVELEQKFIDMCQTYLCPGVVHYSVEERILPAVEAGWVTSATGGLDENGELEYKTYYTKALPERKRYVVTASSRCGNREWHPVHRVIGNKQYAERKLYKSLDWRILKGDSRKLSDLLKGQGLKSVVSPPYESSLNNTPEQKGWDKLANDPTSSRYGRKSIPSVGAEYSDNSDNIGNLKDTPLKSITSPPYDGESSTHNRDRQQDIERMIKKGMRVNSESHSSTVIEFDYGATEGQIGNLKDTPLKSITSPPYQDSQGHPSLGSVNKDDWGKEGKDIVKRRGLSGEYGESEGQVGNLKSITSPPYEESLPNGLDRKAAEQMVQAMYDKHGRTYSKEDFQYQVELILKRSNREYGETEGQIGKLKDKPLKSITSPPYSETLQGSGADSIRKRIAEGKYQGKRPDVWTSEGNKAGSTYGDNYSRDPSNIGNLKDTPLKAITSPPYSDSKKGEIDADKFATHMENTDDWGDRHTEGRMKGIQSMGSGYSEDKENIGNLPDKPLKAITSPPYEQSITGGKSGIEWQEEWGKPSESCQPSQDISYGESKENIGNLKDKPLKAITSPPYSDSKKGEIDAGKFATHMENTDDYGSRHTEGRMKGIKSMGSGYSEDKENIGNLKDKPLKSITSPPYGESGTGERGFKVDPRPGRSYKINDDYSDNPANLGNLPDKPLKSIVSPPYGDAEKRDRSKEASNEKEKDYPRGDHNISAGYQGNDDNIGKLVDKPLKSVVSPPYADSNIRRGDKAFDTVVAGESMEYSKDPNNIGNLSDKPLKSVMSPPYEGGGHHKGMLDSWGGENTPVSNKTKDDHGYGNTEGQVEKAESYLSAMKKVYSEIALVSDVLCVVVKCPTRAGKLRRLDLDTIAILEASGWRIHCQHRALLFEELEQADMFVGSKKQVKGRLSFFKRLSYIKGQPVSSWEDILICVRK